MAHVNLLSIVRTFTIVALFFVFLMMFGFNAYCTYKREDVFISERKLKSKPLKFPTITICVDAVSSQVFQIRNINIYS